MDLNKKIEVLLVSRLTSQKVLKINWNWIYTTLGIDFAGVIKQVGESVSPSDFKQGDEVYGQAGVTSGGSGTFAEMAVANMKSIANKPIRLSYPELAGLPLVGVVCLEGPY